MKIFSVRSLRELMANSIEVNRMMCDFIWAIWITIKVNCFLWRALCNRIPVACNLVEKGGEDWSQIYVNFLGRWRNQLITSF